MDVYIPLTALVDKKLKDIKPIHEVINNFRILAKSTKNALRYRFNFNSNFCLEQVDELFEELCGCSRVQTRWLDGSGIDVKTVQHWVRTRFEPVEQTSTDAEKWLHKLKKYNHTTNTFIFARNQAPSLTNPIGLLGLFWPENDKRGELVSKLDEITDQRNKLDQFANKAETKDHDEAIADQRDALIKREEQISAEINSIKDEGKVQSLLGNFELYKSSQYESKDSTEATEQFWKNGINFLKKSYPKTSELKATWDEQESELVGSKITFVDQLNVMLYLSTSILHDEYEKLNHVEFVDTLVDLGRKSQWKQFQLI